MMRTVCVIGGSGFIGRRVASQLSQLGFAVRIPTRRRELVKHELVVLPNVEVVEASVNETGTLTQVIAGCDVVISLAGILHENAKGDFQRVHADLPRRIVDACRTNAVSRLIHVSALKAGHDAPSEYLRSKAAGEQHVRAAEANGIRTTVFRPSVVFGRDDNFLNLFAQLVDRFPVIPLASPHARFQPVFVEDVARAIGACIDDVTTYAHTFELCGPRSYQLRELVEEICLMRGKSRWIVPLSPAASWVQAWVLECLPGTLMTRDNIRSMQVANVCDGKSPLPGFQPQAIETVVPSYLSLRTVSARLDRYRRRAGR